MSKSNISDAVNQGRNILLSIPDAAVIAAGSIIGWKIGLTIGSTIRARQEKRKLMEIQALLDEVDEALS